jgi:hypothetical protein
VIVLDEFNIESGSGELALFLCFEEEAAGSAEDFRANESYIWNFGWLEPHGLQTIYG